MAAVSPTGGCARRYRVLDQAYAGEQSADLGTAPFSFQLARIDRDHHDRWHRHGPGTLTEVHAARAPPR